MALLPKWDKNKPYVPIDQRGNWMQYASDIVEPENVREHNGVRYYGNSAARIEYIEPFQARLRLLDYYTGRSARGMVLENADTGVKHTMFMSDFIDYIKQGNVVDGIMQGTWTAVKKGANFGIKHV